MCECVRGVYAPNAQRRRVRGPGERTQMKRRLMSMGLAIAVGAMLAAGSLVSKAKADSYGQGGHGFFQFVPDTLVVSRSVYEGTASTVTPGELLPPGCVANADVVLQLIAGGTTTQSVTCGEAVTDGTYPTVFENDGSSADPSFAVSAPIFLDDITTDGYRLGTLAVPADQIMTSFESKSELALNLSEDGKSITFLGYAGGPGYVTAANILDISNSNTPGVIDPTNPDVRQYYRAVAEVDAFGHIQITDTDSYSGDNGRAVIKGDDDSYYMAGNDNNGNLSKKQLSTTVVGAELVNSTGVEYAVPGEAPSYQEIGSFQISGDKPGKDTNFRSVAISDRTLYVAKGSGGNGINTIYQVGTPGVLPTPSNAAGIGGLSQEPITIPTGFFTTSAGASSGVRYPFGMWFANDSTLYVCDEGDGNLVSPAVNGNIADTDAQQNAGLEKWTKVNDAWQLDYTINAGLNIGVPYSVPGYPSALDPATDGCRNLTGQVNFDGTVTVYVVTSTVSASGDPGADPNKLMKVTDLLRATTLATGDGDHDHDDALDHFVMIRAAGYGEVLRGVAFAPTPWGNWNGFGQ
jgi:hypothetical protein